jgi:acyl carrier protein
MGNKMREKIMKILEEIRADVDFNRENQKLIDDEILDSFDIISIVGELNEAFDVEISVDELLPENFNSPDAMVELITKLQEE